MQGGAGGVWNAGERSVWRLWGLESADRPGCMEGRREVGWLAEDRLEGRREGGRLADAWVPGLVQHARVKGVKLRNTRT